MIPMSGKQKREHLKFLADEQRKNAKMVADESRKDQLHGVKVSEAAAKAEQSLGFKEEEHEVKMAEIGGPLAKVGRPLSRKPRMGGLKRLGGKPLGFQSGSVSIPRPAGIPGGIDKVPAMLTEGEAVIPRSAAQDPKNIPIIKRLVNEGRMKNSGATRGINRGAGIQHFNDGAIDVQSLQREISRAVDPEQLAILQQELAKAQGVVPMIQRIDVAPLNAELSKYNPNSDEYKMIKSEIDRMGGSNQHDRAAARRSEDMNELNTEIGKHKPKSPQHTALLQELNRQVGTPVVPVPKYDVRVVAPNWFTGENKYSPNAAMRAQGAMPALIDGKVIDTNPQPAYNFPRGNAGRGVAQVVPAADIPPIPDQNIDQPASTEIAKLDIPPDMQEVSYKLDWTGNTSGKNEAKIAAYVDEAANDPSKGESWLKGMLKDIYGGEDSLFSKKELSRFITVAAGSLLFGGSRDRNGKYHPASLPGSLKFAGMDALNQSDKRVARQEVYKEKREMAENALAAKKEATDQAQRFQQQTKDEALANSRETAYYKMLEDNDVPADVVQKVAEWRSEQPVKTYADLARVNGKAMEMLQMGKSKAGPRAKASDEVGGYVKIGNDSRSGYMYVDPKSGSKYFRHDDKQEWTPITDGISFESYDNREKRVPPIRKEVEDGLLQLGRRQAIKESGGNAKDVGSRPQEIAKTMSHSIMNAFERMKGVDPSKARDMTKVLVQQLEQEKDINQYLDNPGGMDKAVFGLAVMNASGSNQHLYDARLSSDKGYKVPSIAALTDYGNRIQAMANAGKVSIDAAARDVENKWNSNKAIQKRFTDGSEGRTPGYSPMMQWVLRGMPDK